MLNRVLALVMLFAFFSFAQAVSVSKEAPSSVGLGENLYVVITIENHGSQSVDVLVSEAVVNAEPVNPPELVYWVVPEGVEAAVPPSYEWEETIGPGGEKQVEYVIKPIRVGWLNIGPTDVYLPEGKVRSNPVRVMVRCRLDANCDSGSGENALNCPEDCGEPDPDSQPEEVVVLPGQETIDETAFVPPVSGTPEPGVTPSPVRTPAGRCGDGVCDDVEERSGLCPEDCEIGPRERPEAPLCPVAFLLFGGGLCLVCARSVIGK
jgi:hypothetical protein